MPSKDKDISIHKNATPDEKVEVLFRKYYSTLCQGVYNILKDGALAEDVVQEVFIKIWEKRMHLELNENFIFYLKRSCYNAALNVISSSKQKSFESGEHVEVSGSSNADDGMLHSELDNHVQLAIMNLPERTRLVFTLSRFEEMTYKQIAMEMNVSVKAVEKHMGIALQRLRVSLKDHIFLLLLYLLYDL